MRIAFLAPEFYPPWGGVGIYSTQLVKELSKRKDMDIHVFTPTRGKDYDKKKVLKYFGNRIKIHNIGHAFDEFAYNAVFQFLLWKEFPKYHKKYKYDLIHSANLVHMPDIWLKFRNLGIPSVVTAHTTIKGQVQGFLKGNKNFFKMAPSEKGSILAYPIISLLEKLYLKKTQNLITVSHKFAKMFKKEYKFKGKVSVVHNGIDLNLFNAKNISRNKAIYKFPSLKGKQNICLYAGRLITQKGIELFVQAMDRLRNDNFHFVIAGKGDTQELRKLLRSYRIPKDKVTFVGFVPNDQLPYLYKLSDIFVLPSYYENLPIGLIEAMAMGCACIATDVGAVDEIIDNKENGIIVKAGDLNGLTEAIKSIQGNKSIISHGINTSNSQFRKELLAEKTYKVYRNIK